MTGEVDDPEVQGVYLKAARSESIGKATSLR